MILRDKLGNKRDVSVCRFHEGQTVWYKTKGNKAKIKKIWNSKVDKGVNRMFDLSVHYGEFNVPTQCFENEIEEIV